MTKGRKKRKKQVSLSQAMIAILLVVGIFYCYNRLDQKAGATTKSYPTVGTADIGDPRRTVTNNSLPNQEKEYTGMILSFNRSLHIPNWVAWELTADEVKGTNKRVDNFRPDPRIDGCATLEDYRNSGYTRGHMAPSADMKWSVKAMDEACYLSNIVPQLSKLNSGVWSTIESKCREWALRDSAIYIVCGPVIDGNPLDYIGRSGVYVPSSFFKAVISPYADPPLGIGFIVKHKGHKGGMQTAPVCIDEIEKVTGHDFFSSLPDSLENFLEAQNNFLHWNFDNNDR
ncbi:MAG: DNA/RNA non-specific endonuclease [Duncaniella sp.]|nr:DNA/RNA non-specific endonuclease [Duncaniella sp.]